MFICPIYATALEDPKRLAILGSNFSLTYAELNSWISRVEITLEQMELQPGSILSFETSDDVQQKWKEVSLIWAALRKSLIIYPLNSKLPENLKNELVAKANAKRVDLDKIWNNLSSSPTLSSEEPPQLELEQNATLILTSGSTGSFKTALHSLGNHYYSAKGSHRNIPVEENDRWLLNLPLFHVSGLAIIFRVFMSGAALLLHFDPQEVTHLSLVSTQLYRLLAQENLDSFHPKAILLGGSAISEQSIKKSLARGWPVCMSYGLTEMSSQVTATSPKEPLFHGSSGKTLKFRELKIHENQEIYVRGLTLFKGYWNGTQAQTCLNSDCWFATGDLGELNSQGELTVLGRKDNLFISGGENILPETVEKALCQLDFVQRAFVVPIQNAEFGFRPVAFIQTENNELRADFIRSQLKERLPNYMVPDQYFAWDWIEEPNRLKPNRKTGSEIAQKLMS